MAVDISHCGDRTTLDVIEASAKPVLVTHSNCRALVPRSARCKTDEAIRKLAAKGGVMGITMERLFVGTGSTVTIENVLGHIDHVVKLVGVEHVGWEATSTWMGGMARPEEEKRPGRPGVLAENLRADRGADPPEVLAGGHQTDPGWQFPASARRDLDWLAGFCSYLACRCFRRASIESMITWKRGS